MPVPLNCKRAPVGKPFANRDMLKSLEEGYRSFVHDRPGKRFTNLHRRWHQEAKNPALTVAAMVAGIILIMAGIALALVPGVPGIVLGIPGMGLIAAQSSALAKGLDRAEVLLSRLFRKYWRRCKSLAHSPWLSGGVTKNKILKNEYENQKQNL